MNKKFLVLLLIAALTAFLFVGCLPPGPGPDPDDPDDPVDGVVVEIDGAVEIGGKNYVSGGNHDITVTFPKPVVNARVFVSDCLGDYSKQPTSGTQIVLWPNEDNTVWSGKYKFACTPCGDPDSCNLTSECCASYVTVVAGECDEDTCIQVPVIVDCLPPFACIEVKGADCECEDCEFTFKSQVTSQDCKADAECCGDDCSGLAGWSIAIYNKNPFDKCCATTCYDPIWSDSGTDCPIDTKTSCLPLRNVTNNKILYYVIATLVDNVGNEVEYYATMTQTGETGCAVTVTRYCADKLNCACTTWETESTDTSCVVGATADGVIGTCLPAGNCCDQSRLIN